MNDIKKPNILMLLADDMGAWAMGCSGNDDVQTPNLDALAEDGMRFENCFCGSPVCSPARASILTGTIPSAHGVHDWISQGNLPGQKFKGKPVPPQQYIAHLTAYTELLQQGGYTCALSGKWHLGDSMTPQKGFEKWYTIGQGGCWYFRPDIVENGQREVKTGYVTDLITENALHNIDWFSAHPEKPFYLSVHYTAPHSPWGRMQQKPEVWKRYRHTTYDSTPKCPRLHPQITKSAPLGPGPMRKYLLRGYYSAISAMDDGVGRIVERLKEKGLYDNTIIIFTSDNGMSMGHHGLFGKGNATYPPNMFDTSVKIPFIVCYPRAVPRGTVNSGLYSHYDIMSTLIDLLDLKGEVRQKLPGRSFAGLFRGEAETRTGSVVILGEYGISKMIRSSDYKLVLRDERFYNEFYDLRSDPEETRNLFGRPEYADRIAAMRRELEEFLDEYAQPLYRCEGMTITGAGQGMAFTLDKENAFNEDPMYLFPKRAERYIAQQKVQQKPEG